MTNPGSTRTVAEAPSPQLGPAANTKHDHRHNGEPDINPSSGEPSINPTMRRPSTPKNNNRPTPGRGWAPQDENGRCPVPGGAEGLFLAGNIVPGAHRRARKAKRICPSLPGVANAVAAYEVPAAAGGGWRAVLGMRPGDAAMQDAIKREHSRLPLLVHPEKARCAAADGSIKLLRQACDCALSGQDSRGTGRPRHAAPRRAGRGPAGEGGGGGPAGTAWRWGGDRLASAGATRRATKAADALAGWIPSAGAEAASFRRRRPAPGAPIRGGRQRRPAPVDPTGGRWIWPMPG